MRPLSALMLFAALFIEMAVLLSVPLVTSIYKPPGKGIIRFLIYQTLAMPFILLSGWLLAGVEASPGNLALAAQSRFRKGWKSPLALANALAMTRTSETVTVTSTVHPPQGDQRQLLLPVDDTDFCRSGPF